MKKKLWIFNHYATDMYENQSGRHYYFAKYLKETYETTIFCANTFHKQDKLIEISKGLSKKKNIHGITFSFIKTVKYDGNGIKRILNMYFFYKNLLRVARKEIKAGNKPDIILASSVHPLSLMAGVKLNNKFGVPNISEVRDLWPEAIFFYSKLKENSIIGKILKQFEKYLYTNSQNLIFTKPGDIDYLVENKWDNAQGGPLNIDKCHYINNGVDLDTHNSLLMQDIEKVNENFFRITYTGAIRPVNEVMKIIKTAEILKDNSQIDFYIYGDGNQRLMIEKYIKEKQLNNIHIMGMVDKKKIPHILAKSSVNLLNYSQDKYNWKRGNSSNKLFDYLAAGKPIIATFSMGYSLFDHHDIGTQIHDGQPHQIASEILNFFGLKKEAYQRVCENVYALAHEFDYPKLALKLKDILDSNL